MPNPTGENGRAYLGGLGGETAYGAIKRLEEMTNAAPVRPSPGVNAPKAAQRRAVRGSRPEPPQPPQQSVEEQLRGLFPPAHVVWAEVAQIPGISPLVLEWARDRRL